MVLSYGMPLRHLFLQFLDAVLYTTEAYTTSLWQGLERR